MLFKRHEKPHFLFIIIILTILSSCKDGSGLKQLPSQLRKGDLTGFIKSLTDPPTHDICDNCHDDRDESRSQGKIRVPASEKTLFKNYKKLGGDPTAYHQAMCFLNKHSETNFKSYGPGYRKGIQIEDERYVTIQDLNKNSNEKRLFVLDRETGEVKAYQTAHGVGRTPKRNNATKAEHFGNTSSSRLSPTGFFVTGNQYNSTKSWRVGMRLHGLQQGINHNSMRRGIVLHGAPYTPAGVASSSDDPPQLSGRTANQSHGCTTVNSQYARGLINQLRSGVEGRHPYKGGSLYYNFGPNEKSRGQDYCGHSLVPEVK